MRRMVLLATLAAVFAAQTPWTRAAGSGAPQGTTLAAAQEPSTPAQPNPPDLTRPIRTKYVAPVYPAEAMAKRIQGIVIVEAVIDEAGKVASTRVMRSIPELDQAAMDAVRQWEFQPSLRNGQPAAVSMAVTVNFELLRSSAVDVGPEGTERTPATVVPSLSSVTTQCPAAETAAQKLRREAAIQFALEVNFRERLAVSEAGGAYRPLRDLQSPPLPPQGFDVQLLMTDAAYALSVTNTQDACGASVFSDQRGQIYVGMALK